MMHWIIVVPLVLLAGLVGWTLRGMGLIRNVNDAIIEGARLEREKMQFNSRQSGECAEGTEMQE